MKNAASIAALGFLALAGIACLPSGTASAQQIDPALAKPWAFMQQSMPGVSYDLLKDACAEKTVTIYYGTWDDAENAQIAKFKQRFPCLDVKAAELETATQRARFLNEAHANAGIADIVQDTDPGSLDDETKQGLVMHYVISNDKSYPDAEKNAGNWYPLRVALVGMAWNTNEVSDAQAAKLKDWKGATDPSWAGHVGVVAPTGGVGFIPWYMWLKMYGESFFQQIGALKPRVFGGTNPASASLASGDISVYFGASETGLLPMYQSGAPVRWSLPTPGAGVPTGQAIAAHAPHPNAAKLFQEYCFTLEGYSAWQLLGGAPARLDYHDARKVATESWYKPPTDFYPVDPADVTASNQKVSDLFTKYIGNFH